MLTKASFNTVSCFGEGAEDGESHYQHVLMCRGGCPSGSYALEKPFSTTGDAARSETGSHPNHHKKTTTILQQLLALFM